MSILASTSSASTAAGWGGMIIWLVVLFGFMYFFMIRPQQKRQKELNKFRNSLENGTKVVTAGGIYGTVKEVSDDTVLIEVDNGVKLRIAKSMVMRDPSDMMQK